MGAAPIINARSALVVMRPAAPIITKGTICPRIDMAARRRQMRAPRGQGWRVSQATASSARAPTATRPKAKAKGSKARVAIFTSRKDEPHSRERNASRA